MSIIFVGSTVDRETLKTLHDASVAGNKMELGFMHGFACNGINIIGVSVEAHGMWRFNHQPCYIRAKQIKDDEILIKTVPYINIPIIKQLMIQHMLKKELNRVLSTDEFHNSTIVVYNTMSIFARPVLRTAKKQGLNAIAIVADLPIREKKNMVRRIEDRRQIESIGRMSDIIPLTKQIALDFAPDLPYCVVEAGCNPDDYGDDDLQLDTSSYNNVVFSGTLNLLSGIELIINAMRAVKNHDIILDIYGDGPLRQFVETAAKSTHNIHYHGKVTNDQMIAIQKKAGLLVCPREKDSFTTKYTFPSKILEYICSGVPVLSNRLPGIPSEYEQYINYTASESEADWAYAIDTILQPEQYAKYTEKARKARECVPATKTWKRQVERVLTQMKKQGIEII